MTFPIAFAKPTTTWYYVWVITRTCWRRKNHWKQLRGSLERGTDRHRGEQQRKKKSKIQNRVWFSRGFGHRRAKGGNESTHPSGGAGLFGKESGVFCPLDSTHIRSIHPPPLAPVYLLWRALGAPSVHTGCLDKSSRSKRGAKLDPAFQMMFLPRRNHVWRDFGGGGSKGLWSVQEKEKNIRNNFGFFLSLSFL